MTFFTKLHANGNDFILVELTKIGTVDLSKFAQIICDRHYGVGSDGLIVLAPSLTSHTKMIFFNPDGTRDICGNGMRCVARFFYDSESIDNLSIETDNGSVTVTSNSNGTLFSVAMIPPTEITPKTVSTKLGVCTGTLVKVGTPHFIIERSNLSSEFSISQIGRELEHHPEFSEPMNIDLISVNSKNEILIEIWERGVGETLSCGTAACASVISANQGGLVSSPCTVISKGGSLEVEWDTNSTLSLTGPAEITFEGKFKYNYSR